MTVAIAHDYITQRGGAERVVLSMLKAFPEASLHTAICNPTTTYPEFLKCELHTSILNRMKAFQRDHRRALPFLAGAFTHLRITADVVLCSSSGLLPYTSQMALSDVLISTKKSTYYSRGLSSR
jgi:hypothetical protein